MSKSQKMTEAQLKCSSLPPGLAAPGADSNKLSRSRSNAGSKSQDVSAILGEEEEDKEEKSDRSFLGRLFPRRSGRKKKSKEEKNVNISSYSSKQTAEDGIVISSSKHTSTAKQIERRTINIDSNLSIRPNALVRSGPASRQRVHPIDIPASPDFGSRRDETALPKFSPEKTYAGTSPLQAELETHFKNKLASLSTSPPKPPLPSRNSPPITPKFTKTIPSTPPKSPKVERTHYTKYSNFKIESTRESKTEESKNRMKIAGLSSLQQRVLSHNDDIDSSGHKSLTDLPVALPRPRQIVTKSHSFKTTKTSHHFVTSLDQKTDQHISKPKIQFTEESENKNITKSASLDSVQNIENKISEIIRESKELIKDEKKTVEEKEANEVENAVTISGPSHTAIVSVSNNISQTFSEKTVEKEVSESTVSTELKVKEQQVSITKIQVKRDSTQISEFMNVHLNKVEPKLVSTTNVVLASPKIVEEQKKPKIEDETVETSLPIENKRKFSTEDLEIVEKEATEEMAKNVATAFVNITSVTPTLTNRMFKKSMQSTQRKSSLVTETSNKEKPILRAKSCSLEMTSESMRNKGEDAPQNSESQDGKKPEMKKQKSEEFSTENVVIRRKSLMKMKQDDEPELMKVFARRSLKLKDNESEALGQQIILTVEDENSNKSRDSDKENQQDSPAEERKKIIPQKIKDTQTETKYIETTEVQLRKSNNKTHAFQRTVSLTPAKINNEIIAEKPQKQTSLIDRPKTDAWLSAVKNKEITGERKISQEEIINNTIQSDYINEEFMSKPKNFNQRKAEWEKRAQEALKKSIP